MCMRLCARDRERHEAGASLLTFIRPKHKRHQFLVGYRVAVIQHRIDQNLFGQGWFKFSIACQQGEAGRNASAGALCEDFFRNGFPQVYWVSGFRSL